MLTAIEGLQIMSHDEGKKPWQIEEERWTKKKKLETKADENGGGEVETEDGEEEEKN